MYRKRKYSEDKYMHSLLSHLSRKEIKLDETNSSYSFKVPGQKNSSEEKEYLEELVRVMEKTDWSKHDRLFYLVSCDWFKQGHINSFNSTTTHSNCLSAIMETSSTNNPVHNLSLVVNPKECSRNYYSLGREELILKDSIEEGKDYQVITQDTWNCLHSIYGGNGIRINSVPLGVNGKLKKDIKMLKVGLKVKE
jgi:hypothetical protein